MAFNVSQFVFLLPQVDDMVLVVSSVEVDFGGINQQEGKQNEEDLDGVPASIHKVSVKHIGLLQGRHAIL